MKKSKIRFIIIFLALIFSLILAKDSMALTEIFTSGEDCLISILLRKQFYVTGWTTIDDWINDTDRWITELQNKINDVISQMNALTNPGWSKRIFSTQAGRNAELQDLTKQLNDLQVELNYYQSKKAELEQIKLDHIGITDAELESLVEKWKQEIQNKWSLPDYRYNGCCHVNVRVAAITRREGEAPHPGFDQIAIVPGDFRSYITGVGSFDASGFSNNPYNGSVAGVWSKNTRDNYEAPHEAGHEMGLKDQYTDPPTGGGSVPNTGHGKDIMGGVVDQAHLQVVGEGFDNLKIILDGKKAFCPPKCCDSVGISIGTGDIIIGSKPRDTHSGPPPGHGGELASPKIPDTLEQPKDVIKAQDFETPPPPREAVQQTSTDVEGVKVDFGVRYQDAPGGGMNIDTTSLATGKGPDFRKWEVTDTTMVIDGKKVKPVKKDKFYVPKESAMRNVAVAVFVGLGSQYGDYAKDAESGKVCPVTGKPLSESTQKGEMERAIEKAGMTAGLGLLTSQAKGEITGQKSSFNLNKEQAQQVKEGKAALKVGMEHADTRATKKAEMPLGKVSY